MCLFLTMLRRLKIFFHKIIYYGFPVAFWDMLDSQRMRTGIFSVKINEKKHSVILNRLTNKFQYLILACKEQVEEDRSPQDILPPLIWIFWWDGTGTMPPIIKACYNSVLRHRNGYKIELITKDNFQNFISVPEHILEKVKAKIITITHFSDILRMSLLASYGGLWLDASILVTDTIQLGKTSFFTIKRDFGGSDVPRRRWTGFCLGGQKNSLLFKFAQDFFYEYWMKNNDMIDYFLIDYVIAIAYNSFPQVKQMIDNVRENNPNVSKVRYNLENEVTTDFLETIKDTIFHKLTWKKQFNINSSNNKLTLYGYILEKYGE
jgi:hypothetical protein